eukprot:5644770-Alexandrium_andersonii.AAC.1
MEALQQARADLDYSARKRSRPKWSATGARPRIPSPPQALRALPPVPSCLRHHHCHLRMYDGAHEWRRWRWKWWR